MKRILCLVMCLALVGGVLGGCKQETIAESDGITFKIALDDSILSDETAKKIIKDMQIKIKSNVRSVDEEITSVDCIITNNSKYDLSDVEFITIYLDEFDNEFKVSDAPYWGEFTLLELKKNTETGDLILYGKKRNEIKTIILKIVKFEYILK